MRFESFSQSPNKIEKEKTPEEIHERIKGRFHGLSRALFLAGVLLFPSKEILAKEKPESPKEPQKIQKVEKEEAKSHQKYFDEMWKKYTGEEPLPQISDAKIAEELEKGLKELEKANNKNAEKILDILIGQKTPTEEKGGIEEAGKKYLPDYEHKSPEELIKGILDFALIPEPPTAKIEEPDKESNEKWRERMYKKYGIGDLYKPLIEEKTDEKK